MNSLAKALEFLEEAKDIVGANQVHTSGDKYIQHVIAPSDFLGKALAVLFPRKISDIRRLIDAAMRCGVVLVPQGANTGLVGAQIPFDEKREVVLSLLALDIAPEVNIADRTAIVGAGMRLSALNELLREHGLFFPCAIGSDPTFGGLVATNAGGSSQIRYGDVRSNILGLEVVLPTREAPLLDMLSLSRKTNTGLDLKQLFIGTGGSLGVITRVAIELETCPKIRQAYWLGIDASTFRLEEFLIELESSFRSEIVSLEGISRSALEIVARRDVAASSLLAEMINHDYFFLIEFATSNSRMDLKTDADEWFGDFIEKNAEKIEVAPIDEVKAWRIRHELSLGNLRDKKITSFDISVPRRLILRCRESLNTAISKFDSEISTFDYGHIGDGGLHFFVVSEAAPHKIARVRKIVHDIVSFDFSGCAFAEHGVGPANYSARNRLRSKIESEYIREIKALLDPSNVLGHSSP